MKLDIVVDLQNGDAGKAKVVYSLLKNGNYDACHRGSGGANCGHTMYHNGKKIVTHGIPAGVFFGVRSVIGPGCVLHPKSFFAELQYLIDNGIDCKNLVKIAKNVHIVTDEHLKEDALDTKIGTTKRGIGPAYRDKYNRTGLRAKDVPELKEFLVDSYEEIFSKPDQKIIYEGAQGFFLDIDHGDYPYVTSSHTTVAGALLNGFPHTAVNDVYGVIKCYESYVGAKKFQPDDNQELALIQKTGNEFGATTGRARQCNYLNITALHQAAKVNGVNILIVNKMDILKTLNIWKIIFQDNVFDLGSEEDFIKYIKEEFSYIPDIRFSYSPYEI